VQVLYEIFGVLAMVGYCSFDVLTRCFHPESGCSFVLADGSVVVCKYHPAYPSISQGRIFPRLSRGGSVNFAVLHGSKFVEFRGGVHV
jgi:hypothetical protein